MTEEDGDPPGTAVGSVQASVDLTGILPGQPQLSQRSISQHQEAQQEVVVTDGGQAQQAAEAATGGQIADDLPASHEEASSRSNISTHASAASGEGAAAEEAEGQAGTPAAHEPGG